MKLTKAEERQRATYNARVQADHKKLVDQILARRPSWNRAALLATGKTYGTPESPGLWDILRAVQQADQLDEKYGSPELPGLVAELRQCASSWEPGARLLGNVTAESIVRICDLLPLRRMA